MTEINAHPDLEAIFGPTLVGRLRERRENTAREDQETLGILKGAHE